MAILSASDSVKRWGLAGLFVLGGACTTAEGDLFSALQAGAGGATNTAGESGMEPAACNAWQARLTAQTDIMLGGLELWGERVVSGIAAEETARLVELELASRTITNLAVLGDEPSIGATSLVPLDASSLSLSYQNFSIAGLWHIYRSLVTIDTLGLPLEAVRVSEGGDESVGPISTRAGDDFYTAYRQDRRTALTAEVAGEEPVTTILDERLPHPTIYRVLAGQGVAVLLTRDGYELEYFERTGEHRVGERVNAFVADVASSGDTVTLVALRDGVLTRSEKNFAGDVISELTLLGVPAEAAALRIAFAGSRLLLVSLTAAEQGDRLDLYELSGAAATWLGSAPLLPTDPERVRLLLDGARVIVFTRQRPPASTTLEATVFCDPGP
jgi:hypothetical protein